MMKFTRFFCCLALVAAVKSISFAQDTVKVKPALTAGAAIPFVPPLPMSTLRLGIAGMSHDHVNGILSDYQQGKVIIVGIAEADKQLRAKYRHIADTRWQPCGQLVE